MKQHGNENAFSSALKKPNDDESERYCTRQMPDNPIGAAAHLHKWDNMPKRPDDAEDQRRTKNGCAISKTRIGIALPAQFFTNSSNEKSGEVKESPTEGNFRSRLSPSVGLRVSLRDAS